jgi:hypothetical protein
VQANDARVDIPLRITGHQLKKSPGAPGMIRLPMLRLMLREAGTPRVLQIPQTYYSDFFDFPEDSLDFYEHLDTLSIELQAHQGKSVEVLGKTFFKKNTASVAIAEIYDLRSVAQAAKAAAVAKRSDNESKITRFALLPNYPNPFNPSTTIPFQLPEKVQVEITIYDLTGREVRQLLSAEYTAGTYDVVWDGRNSAGTQVSSGVYFYRMKAGSFVQTRKLLLAR